MKVFWTTLFFTLTLSYALSEALADPVKIAVLDTGLDLKDSRFSQTLCKTGHKSYNGDKIDDTVGHGTHVAGIIQEYAGDAPYCMVIFKIFEDYGYNSTEDSISAIRDAVSQGVKIINMSFGGLTPDWEEKAIMAAATNTLFVVAAGNESLDLGREDVNYYPASYALHNMEVVGALGMDGKVLRTSNYGGPVRYWERGEVISTLPNNYKGLKVGTSMAAAVRTGKLIKELYAKTIH